MLAKSSGLLLGIAFALTGLGKLTLLSSAFPALRYAHAELPMIVNAFAPLVIELLLHSNGLIFIALGFYLILALASELAGLIWFLAGIQRNLEAIFDMPYNFTPIGYLVVMALIRMILLCSATWLVIGLTGSSVQQRLMTPIHPDLSRFAHRLRLPHFLYAVLLAVELGIGSFTELDLPPALLPAYAMLAILAVAPYKRNGSIYAAVVMLLGTCMIDFVYAILLIRSDHALHWRIVVPTLHLLRVAVACWASVLVGDQLNVKSNKK
jgi:hypothetical protein